MSRIPKTYPATLAQAVCAIEGARRHGEVLGLAHSTFDVLSAAYRDLAGPAESGLSKSGALNSERGALCAVRQNRRAAMAAGRKFCADAVDMLKPLLGRRWNPRWAVVGLGQNSLAIPHNPHALLDQLCMYFLTNPEREIPERGITAAAAQAKAVALEEATHLRNVGVSRRQGARARRDEAYRRLRKKLITLRHELMELLTDDDPRWLEFGFDRPDNRLRPEKVTEVKAETWGPGAVSVKWEPSPRATNYRVRWRMAGTSDEPVEVGLFADCAATLWEVPSGATIAIQVTARNESGETPPTEIIAQVM